MEDSRTRELQLAVDFAFVLSQPSSQAIATDHGAGPVGCDRHQRCVQVAIDESGVDDVLDRVFRLAPGAEVWLPVLHHCLELRAAGVACMYGGH